MASGGSGFSATVVVVEEEEVSLRLTRGCDDLKGIRLRLRLRGEKSGVRSRSTLSPNDKLGTEN